MTWLRGESHNLGDRSRFSSLNRGLPPRKTEVGVGIMIAHNPLHGSGQAVLPHPALALGDNAHAAQGIGMTDRRQWQPTVDETPHAIPKDAAVLAAPATARDARAGRLGTERSTAPVGSWALRNIGCAHAPPLATTCPVRGWVRACVAEVRLSPRSASLATFCGSFAATP